MAPQWTVTILYMVVHGKSCLKAEKGNVVEEKKAEAPEAPNWHRMTHMPPGAYKIKRAISLRP